MILNITYYYYKIMTVTKGFLDYIIYFAIIAQSRFCSFPSFLVPAICVLLISKVQAVINISAGILIL